METKSWNEPLCSLIHLIICKINSMNRQELDELVKACDKATPRNCTRHEYNIAGIVESHAKDKLFHFYN